MIGNGDVIKLHELKAIGMSIRDISSEAGQYPVYYLLVSSLAFSVRLRRKSDDS
ncbi:hypothetical protein SAMN05444955_1081 [Lihuaxuella thermophila]|uniref:Uncharacterized protein n=1 Tax=Lihuaxuella thermophila TaxID=1173111 RepID=A0A1H8F3Y7_9BACL|nr:hypothetical protein SAMN05444955_1081 [Lihuaxuella thermophila]